MLANSGAWRTSEHVSQGHPDKFCDGASDAILDSVTDAARGFCGSRGPNAPELQRTALEMLAKDFLVVISGEARLGPDVRRMVDFREIVRNRWAEVGYPDADKVTVLDHVQTQSPELQVSSDADGAGDQGIMVGYATAETVSMMPADYEASRSLCRRIQELRLTGAAPWVRADAKTQVTLDGEGKVARVVIAVQHAPEYRGVTDGAKLQALFKEELLELAVIPTLGQVEADAVVVNGTGSFVIGGTVGDAGVVGRKIVVDAYGPNIPVGGGAFSGKDPTKVDRSGAYMARHIAKTAIAKRVGDARAVTVTLAYCIGLRQPEMVRAVTDTGSDISSWVKARFPDLAPKTITETLGLWRQQPGTAWRYQDAAAFGHFGREGFPWERIADVAD
jgi:S-adenosylmethionine synthetase